MAGSRSLILAKTIPKNSERSATSLIFAKDQAETTPISSKIEMTINYFFNLNTAIEKKLN